MPKRLCFISGFCEKLGKSPSENGVFAFPLPNVIVETPDAPSDALVRLGFRRAQYEFQCTVVVEEACLSAILNCSAQEYETSSTTNADAVHYEKIEGGCQNNTTFPVEYSRVGLKIEGAEPSEGMVEARGAVLWGHWVADPTGGRFYGHRR